jgi:hypothetical protein
LRQNLDKSINPFQSLTDSNRLVDLNNINKEFLPKKSSQKKSSKKILPKKSSKKNPRKIQKISLKNPPKNPKKFQTISQKVPNFENIQFPTSHLKAKNPFRLVCFSY